MKYAVIVTGDRNATYDDWALGMYHDFSTKLQPSEYHVLLLHGAARGIDSIAADVWREHWGDAGIRAYPADWNHYGKSAGPRRNQQMLDDLLALRREGYVVAVFAYHPDLEHSKGTKHMVGIAKQAGVRVLHWGHSDVD